MLWCSMRLLALFGAIIGLSTGAAQAQTVASITVTVPDKKADGSYWDVGIPGLRGLDVRDPDLVICAGLPGQAATCSSKCSNTLTCRWGDLEDALRSDGRIVLSVHDVDVVRNDTVVEPVTLHVSGRAETFDLLLHGSFVPSVKAALSIPHTGILSCPRSDHYCRCSRVSQDGRAANMPPTVLKKAMTAFSVVKQSLRTTSARLEGLLKRGGRIVYCLDGDVFTETGGEVYFDDFADVIVLGSLIDKMQTSTLARALIEEIAHSDRDQSPEVWPVPDPTRQTKEQFAAINAEFLLRNEADGWLQSLYEREELIRLNVGAIPFVPFDGDSDLEAKVATLWSTINKPGVSTRQRISKLAEIVDTTLAGAPPKPGQTYKSYRELYLADSLRIYECFQNKRSKPIRGRTMCIQN